MKRFDSRFVPMRVQSILLDSVSNISIIILANSHNEEEIFPLVADLPRGNTIIHILKNEQCYRPRTHDLICDIIHKLQGRVVQVVMHKDEREDVVSTIYLRKDLQKSCLEAQACDALALALKSHVPIYARKNQLLTLPAVVERIQQIKDSNFQKWVDVFTRTCGTADNDDL